MSLERELATYHEHMLELLSSEGKFVLIRGDEIAGRYDSYEKALEAGYERYGLDPFLVKKIQRSEPLHYFSRDLPRCPS